MDSIEQAYEKLGSGLLNFCGDSEWQSAGSTTSVYAQMTQSSYWRMVDGELIQNDRFPPLQIALDVSTAALFIRDEVRRRTGHRLWTIDFKMQPDGKFHINYDYNKPEGYEETDETIDVSLSDFVEKFNKQDGA